MNQKVPPTLLQYETHMMPLQYLKANQIHRNVHTDTLYMYIIYD